MKAKQNKLETLPQNEDEFIIWYQRRWTRMRGARTMRDEKRNAIDVTMLKRSQFDSYGNYLVALKEENNIMEMSSGREWTNLNYTLRPTNEPDENELMVAKMLLDYQIYAGWFHEEWKKWLAERRRYGTCAFFTWIREKTRRTYQPIDESVNWVYDMDYEENIEIQNIFTPRFVPIRNVWIDDKALKSGLKFASDCIIQDTMTAAEILKKRWDNPRFKHLEEVKNYHVLNQNQPYPVEAAEQQMTDEKQMEMVIHYYYNKDTGDVAIIAGYKYLIYRWKMVGISWNLPVVMAQYYPDETCIYGIWIPEKIQPMVIYKEEIVQNLLDNSRMSGSPLLFLANRTDVDWLQNIQTNKINAISFTGWIQDVQMAQVQSNVNNYQNVINFIDSQIIMDSWENLRSTYEPSAAQLWTVEIIENNRNTRLGSLEDSKNLLLTDCLNAAMDNIVQFWYKLMAKTEEYTDKNGKKAKRTINPIIVVPDRKIKQKGTKIEESEDLGSYWYFEFRKDMLKNRYRVVVQTVSNNAVRKIVEKNNLTQYIQNKVALWQLNPQLATPEEIKNIGKLMDMYRDYNFNSFPDSRKDKEEKKIAEMKNEIMASVGMWPEGQWFGGMGIQQPDSQGMQQLTPASPIEWVPEI